jgi:CMP-N-acetylneuraminic acid synthetase
MRKVGLKKIKEREFNNIILAGKFFIAYTTETAIGSDVFSNVIVNYEDREILAVAERYGAESHLRPRN